VGPSPAAPRRAAHVLLGQLHSRHRQGRLTLSPEPLNAEAVARIIVVARDIEFVTEGPLGHSMDFSDQVRWSRTPALDFPWNLLDLDT
jgi:hypothetical protein